ncbi:hypothetical protein EROM_061530 [Encephalitozoon romaleae SJ-2008]|uniref:Uncharacterized protein n=1 Tax=Encephalitozoon romaleae (strain SJ-2008) TaxID=1178016 RepID=I7ANB6_ENCRO|nr:hypothetical protein EROM_061530 [Encephalitozoon romaleae SJ-2008]AFN83244.1 hypothetical protein EROM_061530 [Encephalitozoon romaleae SJ-2008]
MLLKLLFIPVIICNRLLRLKHKDGQYVTNSKGVLKLELPMLPSLSDQRVVVHNRVLYFFKDGIYYTLAMVHGELEIKLIVYNAMSEKGIGFSSNPTFRPRKRKIDPFGYLSHAGHRDNQSDGEKEKDSLLSNKRKPGLEKPPFRNERLSPQKRIERVSKSRPRDHEEYRGRQETLDGKEAHQAKKDKPSEVDTAERNNKVLKDGFDETEALDGSDKVSGYNAPPLRLEVETSSTLRSIRFPKKTDSPRRFYVVESDSKMDEREFGYIIKNVVVSEVDNQGHFTLIGGNDACVTYYKDSFVFMPCSRAPEQIFKLESSEEIVKKGKFLGLGKDKVVENQDAVILDSTDSEDERKEELYKNPQALPYSLKSTGHDSSSFGTPNIKVGSKDRARYLDGSLDKENPHVDYLKRNGRDDLSRGALQFENSHKSLNIDTKPTKTATGVTPISNPSTQARSSRKGSDSNSKEANRHQKLNLDDDFIDKFRELLTNSDLNDFV